MKSAFELKNEIDSKTAEIQAVLDHCKENDREPSPEEQTAINAAFGVDGSTGEIEKLQLQMKNREQIEAKSRELAASKLSANVVANHRAASNKIVVPANAKRHMGLKNFSNDDAGEREAYALGMWLMAKVTGNQEAKAFLKRNNLFNAGEQKEASTLGLELVPAPLEATLLKRMIALSPVLQKVRNFQMTSATLKVPDRLTGCTVSYPAELAAITETNMTFGQQTLTAVKKAALTQISNELRADSVIGIVDTVIEDFAYQLALQTEKEIFLGDGSATYGSQSGLAGKLDGNSKVTAGGATIASIDLADVEACIGLNPFFAGAQQEWYMSMAVWSKAILPILAASGGTPGSEVVSGFQPRLFGFPVNICQTMPSADAATTDMIYFGDLSMSCYYGTRQGVELRVSDVAGDAFATDSVYCRAVMRSALTVDNHDAAAAGAVTAIATGA